MDKDSNDRVDAFFGVASDVLVQELTAVLLKRECSLEERFNILCRVFLFLSDCLCTNADKVTVPIYCNLFLGSLFETIDDMKQMCSSEFDVDLTNSNSLEDVLKQLGDYITGMEPKPD